jgi:hypothetical protein
VHRSFSSSVASRGNYNYHVMINRKWSRILLAESLQWKWIGNI